MDEGGVQLNSYINFYYSIKDIVMADNKTNQIIVVLGSGRSGTSLLMQILENFGMSTSTNMIPAKEQTPTGAYEDREIFQIQNGFIGSVTPHAMPMPADWEKNENLVEVTKQLQNIIADRIEESSTIFGFKDPKTSMLIPMWTRIFNAMNLTPKYILTVRQPTSVITSMGRQYNTNTAVSELFWLTRYTEALHHTGSNCFIVHYEDWFSNKGPEIVNQILEFSGLANYFGSNNIKETLEKIVQPNLNRAVFNEYDVKNRYVLKLYNQLLQCRGDQFDRNELMRVVMECRKAMDEFSGWEVEAQRFFQLYVTSTKNKNNIVTSNKNKNNHLKRKLEKLVLEVNSYLQKCKDLEDSNENLRIKISIQAKETTKQAKETTKSKQELKKIQNDIKRNRKELFTVKTSTSFQVGQILVNAVAKPGKNTLLFPFYLLRLILASRVVKN